MKKLVLLAVMLLVGCGGEPSVEKQLAELKQQNQQLLQQEQLQAQQRQQDLQYQQQASQVQPQAQYQQPMQQAPAPIIVQSAPAQASGGSSLVEGMALGAVAGHLLSGGNNNNSRYNPPQTVINKTYVNKTYETPRVVSRPAANYSAVRSTISRRR
jgi:hypothetical protein